jgi:hypothetical protein
MSPKAAENAIRLLRPIGAQHHREPARFSGRD